MRQSDIRPGDIFSLRPVSLARTAAPPWALTGRTRPPKDWTADLAGLATFDEIVVKVIQAGVPHGPTGRRIGVWCIVAGGFHRAPGEQIALVPTRDLELVVSGAALRPAPETMRRHGIIPGTEQFVG